MSKLLYNCSLKLVRPMPACAYKRISGSFNNHGYKNKEKYTSSSDIVM